MKTETGTCPNCGAESTRYLQESSLGNFWGPWHCRICDWRQPIQETVEVEKDGNSTVVYNWPALSTADFS